MGNRIREALELGVLLAERSQQLLSRPFVLFASRACGALMPLRFPHLIVYMPLGGVGLVLALISRARARSSEILRRVALVCLLGGLLSTLTMQQIWSSSRTPRPGRELAIEYACP